MKKERWKKILGICIVILVLCAIPGTRKVRAAGAGPEFSGWVQDDAALISDEEEQKLEQECDRISKEHHAGVYIITTENFGTGDIEDWQRKIFEEYELGADCGESGIMLAISMAERDWGIVAFGTAQEAFTTYGREQLGEHILDDLSEGEFYDAFLRYVSLADDYFTKAEEGEPYSEENGYSGGSTILGGILSAFILSLLVSFFLVRSWKKGMNTRVRQNGAMPYLREESFHLYQQTDQFLYHNVSRTKKQKQSSSGFNGNHSSGMHSDHSGTSGKF